MRIRDQGARPAARSACAGLLALLLLARPVPAVIRIAASIPDLASIAASVGEADVSTFSIARADMDPHRVQVLPTDMVRVSRADVYLKVGLGLDPWAQEIINGSRNDRLVVLDCAAGIDTLKTPTYLPDSSFVTSHPEGNPHYWLDPGNAGVIARSVAETLARMDPPDAEDYQTRALFFTRQVRAETDRAGRIALDLPKALLTYHASWDYLARALGIEVVTMEPAPGIPPTPQRLRDLAGLIRVKRIRMLLEAPYVPAGPGEFLAGETGLRVVVASPSCEDAREGTYLEHLDHLLDLLAGGGGKPRG